VSLQFVFFTAHNNMMNLSLFFPFPNQMSVSNPLTPARRA